MPRGPGPQIARPSPPRRERDRRLGPFLRGIGRAPEHPGHAPFAGGPLRGLDGGFEGVDDRLVPHLGLTALLYAAEGGFQSLGSIFGRDLLLVPEGRRGAQEGGAVERAGGPSDLADQGHRDGFQYVGRGRRVRALQTFERSLKAAVHVVAVVAVPDLRVELRQVPPVLLHGGGHLFYHVAGGLRRIQILFLRFAYLFPYLVLEYLPEGVARQVIDEHHLAGLLVASQVLAAETRHLLGGESRVIGHHDGHHAFSELGVGKSDDGHLGHPGATFDHLLDLARVDVVATAYYELSGAPAYGEVAVLADGAEIARGEPPVLVEALLGRIRPVPVAGEDVGPADFDLPDLPICQGLARLDIDYPRLLAGEGPSHGTRPALALVGVGEVHYRLGHAVALQDALPEELLELVEGLGTQGRAARDVEPYRPRTLVATLSLPK